MRVASLDGVVLIRQIILSQPSTSPPTNNRDVAGTVGAAALKLTLAFRWDAYLKLNVTLFVSDQRERVLTRAAARTGIQRPSVGYDFFTLIQSVWNGPSSGLSTR